MAAFPCNGKKSLKIYVGRATIKVLTVLKVDRSDQLFIGSLRLTQLLSLYFFSGRYLGRPVTALNVLCNGRF